MIADLEHSYIGVEQKAILVAAAIAQYYDYTASPYKVTCVADCWPLYIFYSTQGIFVDSRESYYYWYSFLYKATMGMW